MGNEKKINKNGGGISKQVHDFETSLKLGKKGESEFHALFSDVLTRSSGYIEDFVITATGEKCELKVDSYDISKTENYFMEAFSYGDKRGGPWQSLEKGIDYFIYYFPIGESISIWRTKELVKLLDKVTDGQYIINIRNTSHNTRGFKVRRDLLADLELDIEQVFGLKGRKGA